VKNAVGRGNTLTAAMCLLFSRGSKEASVAQADDLGQETGVTSC
jgi:hypothetical protein